MCVYVTEKDWGGNTPTINICLCFCIEGLCIVFVVFSELFCILQVFNSEYIREILRASLVAQLVKNRPAMQETWVRFPGREDPLEKGQATHSSLPAWRIPWTEKPGVLQSMGSQRVRHDCVALNFKVSINNI